MLQRFIYLALFHLTSALFDECDQVYKLETDGVVTISSGNTLNARNSSSCRFTLVAPVNYIVDVTCTIVIDQPDSQKCPLKRFFISVDGVSDLRGADYFCSKNGTTRTVRRRSIMNRLVLAYATQLEVANEHFTCAAKRIASSCDCGWSKRARIYNGEDVQIHEFPSMIALVAISINRVFCGGVIISENWALTGAHCFNDPTYSDLKNVIAYVGEHDLTTTNETTYTKLHEIEKFVKHEGYDEEDYMQNNDIALIKMKKSIAFNRAVGPACLPWLVKEDAFDDKFVSVVGFGLLDFFGESPKVLQKVSLQVLPAKTCKDSLSNKAKMCTYAEDKDSCTSDSGGPLYFFKGRQYVVGLVSYGIGCGSKTPSVNSRIISYLPWILKMTEGESFCRKRWK